MSWHQMRIRKSYPHKPLFFGNFGTKNVTVTERVTLDDSMERNGTERGVMVCVTERNAFHSLCNDLHH